MTGAGPEPVLQAQTGAVARGLRLLGVDGAVSYGILVQMWTVGSGLVTVLLVAHFLNPARQGFFYTFRSLIAIQAYFELGMGGVLGIFISHEFAELRWGPVGAIEGAAGARLRCLDFLARATRWFLFAAAAFVVGVIPTGMVFLHQYRGTLPDFASTGAWVFAVLAAALFLGLTPFLAALVGSGEMRTLNGLTLLGTMSGSMLTWTCLATGHGMAAVAGPSAGVGGVVAVYFLWRKPRLVAEVGRAVWRRPELPAGSRPISWRGEVWPMQWRIAITWLSWYFIFQLFTPILFRFQGPVVAGRMGMTLSAVNALAALGFVWVNVKNPVMAKLVAGRRWRELDREFSRMLVRSTGVVVLGSLVVLAGLFCLVHAGTKLAERMLPPAETGLLLGAIAALAATNAFACYLRAHKREPLMLMAASAAVLQGASAWYSARHYGLMGLCWAFFLVCVGYMLPVTVAIWWRCRRAWHAPLSAGATTS